MKGYLAKLNPVERRFVVGMALLFFIVLNVFFVWPHYSDLDMWGNRRATLENLLANYQEKIDKAENAKPALAKLEGSGANVPAEDQAVQFLRTIQTEAARSGVAVTASGRQMTRTNSPFFIQQVQTITVQSGEEQLVKFLYNLGEGDSLVRVSDLSLRPDPQRQQLVAQATLIASYQKNSKAAPSAVSAKTPAAANPTTPVPAPAPHPATPAPPFGPTPFLRPNIPTNVSNRTFPAPGIPQPAIPKRP